MPIKISECLKYAYKTSELYDSMGLSTYSSDALQIVVNVLRDMKQFEEALEVLILAREKIRYRGGARTDDEKNHLSFPAGGSSFHGGNS